VVALTTFAKVYSPQYVLWLTPLAVIALFHNKQQIKFWIWQGGEIIYHIAIWQYLALYTGAGHGLAAKGYAIACLLRVVVILIFTKELMRDLAGKSTAKRP
jgi:acid phosphatase family membrane protein YuiD